MSNEPLRDEGPRVDVGPAWGAFDPGFEINTDAALLDPDWDDFADSHDRRFGLAISHFKSRVRGRAYDNDVMTLRVGPGGYYVQSRRFPAAFFGDTARATVRQVSEAEARATVWEAVAHYRADEAQSLVLVYDDGEPPDVFFGYRVAEDQRYEIGRLRSHVPLHLRILFDAESDVPLLGARNGVLLYQRTRSGRHAVVRAPGRRQPLLTGSFLAG